MFSYESGFGYVEIADTMATGLRKAWRQANRYYQNGNGWPLFVQFEPNGEKVPFADLKAKRNGMNVCIEVRYSFNNTYVETRYLRADNITTIGDVITAIEKEFGVSVIPDSWSAETCESTWSGSHIFERWVGPSSCYYYNVKML